MIDAAQVHTLSTTLPIRTHNTRTQLPTLIAVQAHMAKLAEFCALLHELGPEGEFKYMAFTVRFRVLAIAILFCILRVLTVKHRRWLSFAITHGCRC